jgi:nicotinate-nucleotide adenylyltransferase
VNSAPRRIGLLGGTFDPVHNAHLDLAGLFTRRLALDEVRFLPAGSPWQKNVVGASAAQRLAMLRLALTERRLDAVIDERELRREGPSYTVDSLAEIRLEVGAQAVLVLLIGADQLLRLQTWSRWEQLFELADLAVCGRPSFGLDLEALDPAVAARIRQCQVQACDLPAALNAATGQTVLVPGDLGETSSSAVRSRLAHGDLEGVRDLVPSTVLNYIGANRLYMP